MDRPSQNLPSELSAAMHLADNPLTTADVAQADQQAVDFCTYLDSRYNTWFPNQRQYTATELAGYAFRSGQENDRDQIKYELAGLRLCAKQSLVDFRHMVSPIFPGKDGLERGRNILGLLSSFAMDAAELLERGNAAIDNQKVPYGFGRWPGVFSADLFYTSRHMLRELVWGRKEAQATAIFVLRQALELRLKYALGIMELCDTRTSGTWVVPISMLIKFMKANADSISFPVSWNIVEKINKWSNGTIHTGVVAEAWKIALAQELLEPAFAWGKHGTASSKFGAVKVKKSFLASLPDTLRSYLRSKDATIKQQITDGTHTGTDEYDFLGIVPSQLEAVAVDELPTTT